VLIVIPVGYVIRNFISILLVKLVYNYVEMGGNSHCSVMMGIILMVMDVQEIVESNQDINVQVALQFFQTPATSIHPHKYLSRQWVKSE
jgi:hypothetical protein